MNSLVHCIYTSSAGAGCDAAALRALLQQARHANEAAGVTGVLVHARGSFFQLLEGRPAAVEAIFERIYADPRHHAIAVILFESIAQRAFGDWAMAYAEITDAEIAALVGSGDVFAQGFGRGRLDVAGARRLVEEFCTARWRTRLADEMQAYASNA